MAVKRISWDELFMQIAFLYGERSVCKHFRVGVVFARGNIFLSAGYNGPPSGEPHCIEVGCAKEDKLGNRLPAGSGLCRGAHAEMNAIANASKEGVNLSGATVYCTFSPCFDCSKVLVNLGIREFVFMMNYGDEKPEAIELFRRHVVKVRQVKIGKFNEKEKTENG